MPIPPLPLRQGGSSHHSVQAHLLQVQTRTRNVEFRQTIGVLPDTESLNFMSLKTTNTNKQPEKHRDFSHSGTTLSTKVCSLTTSARMTFFLFSRTLLLTACELFLL